MCGRIGDWQVIDGAKKDVPKPGLVFGSHATLYTHRSCDQQPDPSSTMATPSAGGIRALQVWSGRMKLAPSQEGNGRHIRSATSLSMSKSEADQLLD
jgi:hypothetical protein